MHTTYTALDYIFPPRCLQCNIFIVTHHNFCHECWSNIQFITTPHCRICGMPVEFSSLLAASLCNLCISHRPIYHNARSALAYDLAARPLITRFKYHDYSLIAPVFAKWMATAGKDILLNADIIVPVPLHWRRFLFRRYNQSSLLAYHIGKLCCIPFNDSYLVRKHHTTSQAQLSRKDRLNNVKEAFHVELSNRPAFEGKHIILIDDVMTSGATISACSQTLLNSGASKVSVLTLARTLL